MDELTREFLIESQEGLDRMERCLTDLEARPQDAALLGEIFRSVHTIKGTTGFLGFKRLEKLAHAGENLLGLLRDGKLVADGLSSPACCNCSMACAPSSRPLRPMADEGGGDDSALIERLVELQSPAQVMQQAERRAQDRAQIGLVHRRSGPAASASQLRRPPRRDARRLRADASRRLPSAPGPQPSPKPTPRRAQRDPLWPDAAAGSAAESTLRVDVTLLNRMMNLVGELVLTRNQVLQATAADPNMTLLSRRLDMVTADLRETVMKARMQPVSNIFSKMPRIVRDLSQSLGRRVRLQMEGQETELDKSLLEAIKDPLTHAVRNSLDHGIEPPEVRQAAGKDPEGTLRLRASAGGQPRDH